MKLIGLITIICSGINAQTNISIEGQFAKEQQFTQLSFTKEWGNFCASAHLGYGNYGKKTLSHGVFSEFYAPYSDAFSELPMFYDIKSYTRHNIGLSIGLSPGIVLKMNKKNQFLIQLPLHFYFINDHFSYRYIDEESGILVEKTKEYKHNDASISLMMKYHFIFSQRFGCYAGINIPYFKNFSKLPYVPDYPENVMKGLRSPSYLLGITYHFKTNEL